VGDWHLNNQGRWVHDPNAPSPGTSPPATQIMPSVPAKDEPPFDEAYEREDGAIYGRPNPSWFEPFDEVDSRTIRDPGAPT
jgi:hypothetical protein